MMRRLPIYLVIDTSGSMSGAPINAVNQGIQMVQAAVRSDPRALETAFLSLITFDSDARQVVPLTEAGSFMAPTLQAGGGTNLGAGLRLLDEAITREVVTVSSGEQRGDWRPVVFIMTDGQPTDGTWPSAADTLKARKFNIIACAAGFAADEHMLKRVTNVVVKLADTSEQSIREFFKWVTASIKTASASMGTANPQQGVTLPPAPPEIVIIP
jgi:uncharacterized protein YegL